MYLNRTRRAGITVVAFLMGCSGRALACTCAPPPPAEQWLAEMDAVFWGEFIDQDPECESEADRNVVFRVLVSWKGVTDAEVSLVTIPCGNISSCGFFGDIGEHVLVLATRDGSDLRLSGCSKISGPEAGDYAADLDRLTNRILNIDPQSVPPPPRSCGLGVLQFSLVGLFGLLMLQKSRRP